MDTPKIRHLDDQLEKLNSAAHCATKFKLESLSLAEAAKDVVVQLRAQADASQSDHDEDLQQRLAQAAEAMGYAARKVESYSKSLFTTQAKADKKFQEIMQSFKKYSTPLSEGKRVFASQTVLKCKGNVCCLSFVPGVLADPFIYLWVGQAQLVEIWSSGNDAAPKQEFPLTKGLTITAMAASQDVDDNVVWTGHFSGQVWIHTSTVYWLASCEQLTAPVVAICLERNRRAWVCTAASQILLLEAVVSPPTPGEQIEARVNVLSKLFNCNIGLDTPHMSKMLAVVCCHLVQNYLLVSTNDSYIRLYDAPGEKELKSCETPRLALFSHKCRLDGKDAVCNVMTSMVWRRRRESGTNHFGAAREAWRLLTGHHNGQVLVWEIGAEKRELKLLFALTAPGGPVRNLVVVEERHILLVGVETGRLLLVLLPYPGQETSIGMCPTPDKPFVIKQPQQGFQAHRTSLAGLSYWGGSIATYGKSGNVRIWELLTLLEMAAGTSEAFAAVLRGNHTSFMLRGGGAQPPIMDNFSQRSIADVVDRTSASNRVDVVAELGVASFTQTFGERAQAATEHTAPEVVHELSAARAASDVLPEAHHLSPQPPTPTAGASNTMPLSEPQTPKAITELTRVVPDPAKVATTNAHSEPAPLDISLSVLTSAQSTVPGKPSGSPVKLTKPTMPDMSQTRDELLIPRQDIQLIEVIGSGSEGKVWLSKWHGQDVAVKEVHMGTGNKLQLLSSSTSCERSTATDSLMKEVYMLSKLTQHPNIVRFFGVAIDSEECEVKRPPGIVMEYYSMGSLYNLIELARDGDANAIRVMSWPRPLDMLLSVAAGMAYLHSKNCVHGDLRSPNLFVDKSQRNGRSQVSLKVGDFGFAKLLGDDTSIAASKITNPRWMSPEALEHGVLSKEADVYSFGICMWEILTWGVPFENLMTFQVMMAIVMSDTRPEIPEDLDKRNTQGLDLGRYKALMESCWCRDPKKRPSFKEIIDKLSVMKNWKGVQAMWQKIRVVKDWQSLVATNQQENKQGKQGIDNWMTHMAQGGQEGASDNGADWANAVNLGAEESRTWSQALMGMGQAKDGQEWSDLVTGGMGVPPSGADAAADLWGSSLMTTNNAEDKLAQVLNVTAEDEDLDVQSFHPPTSVEANYPDIRQDPVLVSLSNYQKSVEMFLHKQLEGMDLKDLKASSSSTISSPAVSGTSEPVGKEDRPAPAPKPAPQGPAPPPIDFSMPAMAPPPLGLSTPTMPAPATEASAASLYPTVVVPVSTTFGGPPAASTEAAPPPSFYPSIQPVDDKFFGTPGGAAKPAASVPAPAAPAAAATAEAPSSGKVKTPFAGLDFSMLLADDEEEEEAAGSAPTPTVSAPAGAPYKPSGKNSSPWANVAVAIAVNDEEH